MYINLFRPSKKYITVIKNKLFSLECFRRRMFKESLGLDIRIKIDSSAVCSNKCFY